jgi:hypothetical protein
MVREVSYDLPTARGRGSTKYETRNSKQTIITQIQITKTLSHTCCWIDFVLNFEHSDFDIVSDFGFRYSDFHKNCVVFLGF